MFKKKLGAPKRFPEKYYLRLPKGTLARIDTVSDSKAEFIRAAVIEALSKKPRKVVLTPAKDRDPEVFHVTRND